MRRGRDLRDLAPSRGAGDSEAAQFPRLDQVRDVAQAMAARKEELMRETA
ncbi:Repair of Iron Centers di-iron protein [Cupriavidus necator H850]|nr:Repair of Iron Centers di-iron protein [Cupriavidus necator H850]